MPMPASGSTFNYYSPSNNYGATQNFAGSEWTKAFFDQQPEAYWTRWGAQNGVGQGESAFEQYYRSQRNRAFEGYEAALGTNPLLRFQDYVDQQLNMDAIRSGFSGLSAAQRGERQAQFAPNARYVMRG